MVPTRSPCWTPREVRALGKVPLLGSRWELRSAPFLIAVAQTDLALRNQPIRVLVAVDVLLARSRSALQVEFIGAAANLFFEIDREIDREIDHNEVGRLPILRNFGRNLHSGR